ncbi:hypothetical protein IWQ60_006487 [Tieghemiomyces parasiticus]|uniref:Uncharacterized protein n=1 Tax=Tieghemiomyces parasiticus TaxID=78921 RepID=A0A9W8DXJ6_9FUNG|nr:hypothetical protein IWQ60_006487 [Tieghemiomyces parasiticus]
MTSFLALSCVPTRRKRRCQKYIIKRKSFWSKTKQVYNETGVLLYIKEDSKRFYDLKEFRRVDAQGIIWEISTFQHPADQVDALNFTDNEEDDGLEDEPKSHFAFLPGTTNGDTASAAESETSGLRRRNRRQRQRLREHQRRPPHEPRQHAPVRRPTERDVACQAYFSPTQGTEITVQRDLGWLTLFFAFTWEDGREYRWETGITFLHYRCLRWSTGQVVAEFHRSPWWVCSKTLGTLKCYVGRRMTARFREFLMFSFIHMYELIDDNQLTALGW